MFDVLSMPAHRAANVLFITLNILAATIWAFGIVAITAYLVATDLPFVGGGGFTRFVASSMMFIAYFTAGILLMLFAQIIRYVASIAETNMRALRAPTQQQIP